MSDHRPVPTCHPNRRLYTAGLCYPCWESRPAPEPHLRYELVGRPLSPRETEALALLAKDDTGDLRAVAREMGVTYHTVRNTLSHAYAKLGVSRAIPAFRTLGWLQPGGRA